jgi:hypothetical protein
MSTRFKGSIGKTYKDSKQWWPQPIHSHSDSPNILYVILDDVVYGWLSCYGSSIETPNMDKLAAKKLTNQDKPHEKPIFSNIESKCTICF